MAIQHRRGADVDFKPDRMKAGELALTTDGTRKMYAAFAPGDVKEVAFKEDIPENGGGGGSFEQVQADYAQTDSTQPDYIKNKLVGKEVTYSDTLTWDGNTEGLESVADMFFRISDIVPTINDLKDGAIMTFNSGTEIELVASDNGDVILLSDENGPLVIITKVDNVIFSEIPFGSSGIYAMLADPSEYMVSLEIPNYQFPTTTTKKLTAEYMEPFEVVTKGGDTLTWDGDTSGLCMVDMAYDGVTYHYRVSENFTTLAEVQQGVVADGITLNVMELTENIGFECYVLIDDIESIKAVVFSQDANPAEGVVFLKGLYFYKNESSHLTSLTINGYTGFVTTEKKLKGEYVIDTNSIILKSSGGKRFKVTVSDTGTLTATEI